MYNYYIYVNLGRITHSIAERDQTDHSLTPVVNKQKLSTMKPDRSGRFRIWLSIEMLFLFCTEPEINLGYSVVQYLYRPILQCLMSKFFEATLFESNKYQY